jgi:hypothetical protein
MKLINIQNSQSARIPRIIEITIIRCFGSIETEAYLYAYMTQTTVFMTQHQNCSLTKVSRCQERYAKLSLRVEVSMSQNRNFMLVKQEARPAFRKKSIFRSRKTDIL